MRSEAIVATDNQENAMLFNLIEESEFCEELLCHSLGCA
jgi:hypothetical protein